MQVEVRLYATLREFAPADANAGVFLVTLPENATLGFLLTAIGIEAKKVHMRIVNGIMSSDEQILKENDRIGLFPPVGGG